MSVDFETPSYDALLAEQASVQAEKFQGRILTEYTYHIFPGQSWRKPRGSAVADFIRPITGHAEHTTLEGVLEGLSKAKEGGVVHWVDMGGGRALPMRQLGSTPDLGQRLRMTNVDLFDFGLEGLTLDELEYLEGFAPGMTEPGAEPTLMIGNVEIVRLPELADIITSVETMQYLNNPLQALSNWYNQLADNGVMFIATEHEWTGWVRYHRGLCGSNQGETPVKHLLEALSRADINYAVTDESDSESGVRPGADPDRIRIMAIQKRPGTSLRVTKPVAEVWVNPYNFKAVYYEAPAAEAAPVVEVVNIPAMLGAISVGNSR